MSEHRFDRAEEINLFVKSGKAIFTLVSSRTGARYTYRVKKLDRAWVVQLLTGPDNEADYQYVGLVWFDRPETFRHGGAKARISEDAPGVRAFAWFWGQLHAALAGRPQGLAQCEVWHEGRCGRCGRRLTVPESIATGLGPECAGLAMAAGF